METQTLLLGKRLTSTNILSLGFCKSSALDWNGVHEFLDCLCGKKANPLPSVPDTKPFETFTIYHLPLFHIHTEIVSGLDAKKRLSSL